MTSIATWLAAFATVATLVLYEAAVMLTQGTAYVRRAGLLYSWGLRHLVLVAPVVVFIVHPFAGPLACIAVVMVLRGFDRASSASAASSDLV